MVVCGVCDVISAGTVRQCREAVLLPRLAADEGRIYWLISAVCCEIPFSPHKPYVRSASSVQRIFFFPFLFLFLFLFFLYFLSLHTIVLSAREATDTSHTQSRAHFNIPFISSLVDVHFHTIHLAHTNNHERYAVHTHLTTEKTQNPRHSPTNTILPSSFLAVQDRQNTIALLLDSR